MSDEHTRCVVAALERIAATTLLWPNGLVRKGGPHRRLRGMPAPISIGEDECLVFVRLVDAFKPKTCFIVGNGFGFSAAVIGRAMMANGGEAVITLDSQAEGDGQYCAKVAQALADELGLSIVKNKKGMSPDDVPSSVDHAEYDLVFLDGKHSHPQVTRDLNGILPFTHDRTIFVWHDFWIRGIPESVEESKKHGVRCWWIPTSCEMVVGTRDESLFEETQRLFPNGEEGRTSRNLVHFLMIVAYELSFRYWDLLKEKMRRQK